MKMKSDLKVDGFEGEYEDDDMNLWLMVGVVK